MTLYAVQYLESMPEGATPAAVQKRLRQACQRLPVSLVLLGWDLPEEIEQAVADEASRLDLTLYRWQPWLTGDAHTDLPAEWAARGLQGDYVPGHNNLPEFTFACPNRSGVADFLAERLETIADRGLYQGIFLDRIRFPSPAADPPAHLGCFCNSCTRLAADAGIDLHLICLQLQRMLASPSGALRMARGLLDPYESATQPLQDLLNFRQNSLTRLVQAAYRQAGQLGLSLGLDCFSPSLARLVGQDLGALDTCCDWIKLMTYPRVWGPAGISFELLNLADWLVGRYDLSAAEAFAEISLASSIGLPNRRSALRKNGLDSTVIAQEIQYGKAAGISTLLAGIPLVELPGIHQSTPQQIQSDWQACQSADGLVLSWDLWHIPLSLLETIPHWLESNPGLGLK
jgi:hypothetical protein